MCTLLAYNSLLVSHLLFHLLQVKYYDFILVLLSEGGLAATIGVMTLVVLGICVHYDNIVCEVNKSLGTLLSEPLAIRDEDNS